MAVRSYKVLEEHIFDVEGLNHPVKGRVSLCEDLPADVGCFYWQISHHYKPTFEPDGKHYPSHLYGKTLEEARDRLMTYAKNFSTEIVEVDPDY
ncbi:hypothetical protein ACX0MV_15885 [Pseudomonas borbori]